MLSAPRRLLTFVIVFAGILSNTASEVGYVLLVPLGAMIFLAKSVMGRFRSATKLSLTMSMIRRAGRSWLSADGSDGNGIPHRKKEERRTSGVQLRASNQTPSIVGLYSSLDVQRSTPDVRFF